MHQENWRRAACKIEGFGGMRYQLYNYPTLTPTILLFFETTSQFFIIPVPLFCSAIVSASSSTWPARVSSSSPKGLAMVSSLALVSSSQASCGVFLGYRIDIPDMTRRRAKNSTLPQEV